MNPDAAAALQPEDFDALEAILDDLRTRDEEVPQWEFMEGALAALACTRRPIEPQEWLPLVLGTPELPTLPQTEGPYFANTDQYERFMALCLRRLSEIREALAIEVDTLEDERSYHPELMDVRGAVASLPEAERPPSEDGALPSYGQIWALGFLFVVENWEEDWALPRDKETAAWIDEALETVVTVSEDDRGPASVNLHDEDGPPSVSDERLNDVGAAIWAVYDLHRIWQSLGPRVQPLRQPATPGRNDPCPCGSGKKYKKCHGQA